MDHASLRWVCRRKVPFNQVARWLEILAEFSYKPEDRDGVKHGNADGPSRQAYKDCGQCELIERQDGGPSRQELDQDRQNTTSPALKLAAKVDQSSIDQLCSAAKIITRRYKTASYTPGRQNDCKRTIKRNGLNCQLRVGISRSRQGADWKIALGFSQQVTTKPKSYSAVCKKTRFLGLIVWLELKVVKGTIF